MNSFVRSSLAIEENLLSLAQVSAVLDGRPVWSRPADIIESERLRPDAARDYVDGCLDVITGTSLAYTRNDGVHVVPLGVLGP